MNILKKLVLVTGLTATLTSSLTATDFDLSNDILVSGFSYHLEDHPYGITYNEKNYGIGYRYMMSKKDYEINISTMALKDSYSNIMYMSTLGTSYHLYNKNDLNIRIGVDAGVGYRKRLYISNITHPSYTETTFKFKYGFIPIVAPRLSVDFGKFGINLIIVPGMLDNGYTAEVLYVYFNIKL